MLNFCSDISFKTSRVSFSLFQPLPWQPYLFNREGPHFRLIYCLNTFFSHIPFLLLISIMILSSFFFLQQLTSITKILDVYFASQNTTSQKLSRKRFKQDKIIQSFIGIDSLSGFILRNLIFNKNSF